MTVLGVAVFRSCVFRKTCYATRGEREQEGSLSKAAGSSGVGVHVSRAKFKANGGDQGWT